MVGCGSGGALGTGCPGGEVPWGRGAQGAWCPGGVGPWGRGSLGRAAEVLGLWRDTPQIHQTNQVSFQRHDKKGHFFTCNCKNLLAEQYLHDQIDISFSSPDFTCLLTIKHSSESWVNLSPTIKNLFSVLRPVFVAQMFLRWIKSKLLLNLSHWQETSIRNDHFYCFR